MSTPPALPTTVDAVIGRLADAGYLADRRLGTAVFLALTLRRPLFLEGEPGVGKTELAKALASVLEALLLRVQCYEGLDIAQTAYEWNVARQMMEIRLAEAAKAVKMPTADVNADLHGSAEYRAAMISVIASRAVAAALAR